MKLLFAIKEMHRARGGAERVMAEVCNGLVARGHDVTLLSYDNAGEASFYPLHKDVKQLQLGIGRLQKRANISDTFKRMRAVRKTIKTEQPDAVVAFMHSMFIPVALAAFRTGIPVVASEHIVPRHYRSRLHEFLLFLFSSFYMRNITVLSRKVRHLYPPILQKRMIVVPNPVQDHEEFKKPANDDAARKIILNVGRMDAQKDQATLIKAFAMLADTYPEWDLRIIGDGELRQSLENLVNSLGLRNRIFMPGTTEQIEEEYKAANIFALSSVYESFGLATAEAMSYCLPAIGFADCPGTNELIVNHHNGLLVSGADRVKAFADGLEVLMSHSELAAIYGANAADSMRKFKPERVVDRWENILRRAVA